MHGNDDEGLHNTIN